MKDPAEIRWPGGCARVAYVGSGRWRRGAAIVSLRELVDAIARSVEAAPGRVELVAPGVHDTIDVAVRTDLIGVLPPGLVPLDVTRPKREPFVAFAFHWLDWNAERCWPDDVSRPSDHFDALFSAAAFESSADRASLAADLESALAARLRDAAHPEQIVETAIRELAARGHVTTFADGDGEWMTWASQWVVVTFNPPRDCSVTVSR